MILGLVGTLDDAYAAPESFTSFQNGFYDSAATWRDGMNNPGVPGVADTKFINHDITIQNPQSNSGQIQLGSSGTLEIDSTFTNDGFFDGFTTNGVLNFGGNVNVTNNGIYQNNGLFDNLNGGTTTIDFGGQFNNNFASGNAHFHNEDGLVTVDGSLTNFGDIHQLLDGVITVSGSGSFTTSGANGVTDNRPGSTINNSNILDIQAGGTINNIGSSNINNNMGGTVELDAGFINNNGGNIANTGTIDNLLNSIIKNDGGTITNNALGFLSNKGGFINNLSGSTINNDLAGNFQNRAFSTSVIDNFGTINNSGFFIGSFGSNLNNNNTGTIIINPSGQLFLNGGDMTNSAGGTVTNSNSFIINGLNADFGNFGTINNNSGGTIALQSGGEIRNDATIHNNSGGTIEITGASSFFNFFSGGTINNNSGGTIDNRATSNPFLYGLHNAGGTINNFGEIFSEAILANDIDGIFNNRSGGVVLSAVFGDFQNDNGATFINFAGATLVISGNGGSNAGFLTNYGTFNIVSNTLTNESGGLIRNFGGTMDNGSTINNSGLMFNCGTYTGSFPTGNILIPCTIDRNTTFTDDVTLPSGTSLTVDSGFVLTLDPGVTLDFDVDDNITIKSGGGIMIKVPAAILGTRG